MKRIIIFVIVAALILAGGYYANRELDKKSANDQLAEQQRANEEQQKLMAEIKIEDEVVGGGAEAVNGKNVTVNYTGTLDDGKKFDSSYDHGQPFTFRLGSGQVIKGWDLGILGMKVGGKRKLTIPPDLAYGANGAGNVIPPDATLHFEVELLKVED